MKTTFCKKKTYKDRKTAKKFMKMRNLKTKGTYKTAYYCDKCDAFHVSSWTKAKQLKYETR
jgi:hypothetical protein